MDGHPPRDPKQFVTRLGCVVALFGVVAIMAMKLAQDLDVLDHYTWSIVNMAVLCVLVFPTLITLLVFLLKDWVKKSICGLCPARIECVCMRGCLQGLTGCCCCFETCTPVHCCNNCCKSHEEKMYAPTRTRTRNKTETEVRDEAMSRSGRRVNNVEQLPGDEEENTSLVTTVRDNVRKGYTAVKNTIHDSSEKLAAKLFSSHGDPTEYDEIPHSHREGYGEEGKKRSSKGYDSLSQTPSASQKPFRNSQGKSMSTEEIFRKHFNISDSKSQKTNSSDTKDANSWFVFLKREGSKAWDSLQDQNKSPRNDSTLERGDNHSPSRDNRNEAGRDVGDKPVRGSGRELKHSRSMNRKKRSMSHSSLDKVLEDENPTIEVWPPSGSGSRDAGTAPEMSGVPAIRGDENGGYQSSRDRGKAVAGHGVGGSGNSAGRGNGHVTLLNNHEGHEDSDSSKVAVEELFRQYFGLNSSTPSSAQHNKFINAGSGKSQSWSDSIQTAGTGKEFQKVHEEIARQISRSDQHNREISASGDRKGSRVDKGGGGGGDPYRLDGCGRDYVGGGGGGDGGGDGYGGDGYGGDGYGGDGGDYGNDLYPTLSGAGGAGYPTRTTHYDPDTRSMGGAETRRQANDTSRPRHPAAMVHDRDNDNSEVNGRHGRVSRDGYGSDSTSVKMFRSVNDKDYTTSTRQHDNIHRRGSHSSVTETEMSYAPTRVQNNNSSKPKTSESGSSKDKRPGRAGVSTSGRHNSTTGLDHTEEGGGNWTSDNTAKARNPPTAKSPPTQQDRHNPHNSHKILPSSNFRARDISDIDSISIASSRYSFFPESQDNIPSNQSPRKKLPSPATGHSERPAAATSSSPVVKRGRHQHMIEVDSEEEKIMMMIRRVKGDRLPSTKSKSRSGSLDQRNHSSMR